MMRAGGALLLTILMLTATLLYVRGRSVLVELSYDLSEKRSRIAKLKEERRSLSVELATLKSPQRVERIARQKLNLSRTSSPSLSIVSTEAAGR